MLGSLIVPLFVERIASGLIEKGISYIIANDYIYSNWVYRRIAEGARVNLSFYIIVVIFIAISIAIVRKDDRKLKKYKCQKECKNCENKHTFTCVAIKIRDWYKHADGYVAILLALWIVIIAFLSLTNFVNHTIIRISNSIEIVAPYIDDSAYKKLRSDYYLMENYGDYCELMRDLQEYAENSGINLKK